MKIRFDIDEFQLKIKFCILPITLHNCKSNDSLDSLSMKKANNNIQIHVNKKIQSNVRTKFDNAIEEIIDTSLKISEPPSIAA